MLPIIHYVDEPISDEMAQLLQTITTVEWLLQWIQKARLHLADMVQQDEYTTDVVVVVRETLVLSFDVSCIGNVRGIAVWDRTPSPQELLQARLARGWQPTDSDFVNGPRVIGNAGESSESRQ